MRIAVCFSGQLRTGVWAIPAIKSFIGDLWENCDFFFHTWDSHYNKNYSNELIKNLNNLMSVDINYTNPNRNIWTSVSSEDLARFLTIYNPKLFLIENYNTTFNRIADCQNNYIRQHHLTQGFEYFPPILYYSHYRSVEMVCQYEQQHEFTYDIIIKLRPDAIFPMDNGGIIYRHKRADLKKDIEKVLNNPNTLYYADDIYWISTGEIIKKTKLYWKEGINYQGTQDVWSYISNMGINVERAENHTYTLLRNLWKRLPVDDFFMLDSFERFFVDLPPNINNVINPQSNFHEQYLSKLKSYIHNYSIIKELCDETNCTIN
jgi:hypothetical protein